MKNIILLLITLSSCASTQITSSWKEPNKQVSIEKLHKVLVVAIFKNQASRRKAEDQMVGYLQGAGVVSYNYLNKDFDNKNEDAIRVKTREDAFDGAITMRLVDVDREQMFTIGDISQYPAYNRNFEAYFLRNKFILYNPESYYAPTKIYTVQVNVYSLKENKIIWTGLTETTNPDGVKNMTEQIARVVYKKMVKEGFVKK